MNNKIEIQLSKTKIILLLIGSLAFVIAGVFFILNPEMFSRSIFGNQLIVRIIGISAILFFGLCLIFISRKLFDNRIGFIIDDKGITDNSNAFDIGLIEWEDIVRIETLQIASTKLIMIDTIKPEKYIDRAKNGMMKKVMQSNYKMYGSPISISTNALKIKHNELEAILLKEFAIRQG
ncbi:STM3941 family protein [Marinigracilibium pacificum]|uniref:PH (Pleckstrin Homology) domain-containing protein n=1 Tax=Marinigracilibium pacificum TaxID=2729599 RepID=A0A848ITJ4_9BACT|nr:STM3941 family protein [Marinigracilibium pacificum]NMM47667.1 hypothetical protein [Marinigracilibium pacificum]